MQVFNDAIEALRVSYRKMNPFCVPFATTNMGSAILAMDLVIYNILSCMVNNDHSHYTQNRRKTTIFLDGSYFLLFIGLDGTKLLYFHCMCHE